MKNSEKVNVYLTVDTECRRNSPSCDGPIYGRLKGKSELLGLDFILDTLEKFSLKTTFFLEPFFSYKFGLPALRKICGKILSKNQEIQLHMHPYFKSNSKELFEDELHTYDYKNQVSLIQEAKDILLGCGVSKIDAFRAGSFAINNTTYAALKKCDINISSNYNLDFLNKTCKVNTDTNHNEPFYCQDGILEMPITCFSEYNLMQLKKSFKHMQITAASFSQMKYFIAKAAQFNVKNIVILFHTFEFIDFIDEQHNIGKPNKINIKRFLNLCEFLSQNKESIEVKTISDIDKDKVPKSGEKKNSVPSLPLGLSLLGKFEQAKKKTSKSLCRF
jgi:hypothetical protein